MKSPTTLFPSTLLLLGLTAASLSSLIVTTAEAQGVCDVHVAVGRSSGDNMRWAIHDDAAAGFVQLHSDGEGWGDSRGTTALAFGDVDGDGRLEVAIGRNSGGNMRWAIHDDANAGFVQLHSDGEGWGDSRGATALAFGDVDGDGLDEIAIGRNSGGNMRWAIHDDANAGFVQLHSDGEGWGDSRGATALAFGDVDDDGLAEIAIGRNGGGNMRWAIHDDADAGFVQLHSNGEGWGDSRGATALAFGDVDGDSLAEIAIGRNGGGNMRWAIHDDADAGFVQLHSNGEGWGDSRGTTALALAIDRNADQDRDGDGLLDRWESNGIDVDCDGVVDLDLAALGANPERKDIFVEVDYMEFHDPMPDAMQDVVGAFANAPVENPDGSTGISLRLTIDEELTHQNDITTWTDVDSIKAASFGTQAERTAANADAILAAKAIVFRYALFAHQRDGGGSSGRGRGSGDFVVSLGAAGWGTDPLTGHTVGTQLEQAGTFMHELGHTLDLRHGGGDGDNCKPNYISVMSYSFQTNWITNRDLMTPRLDYSSQVLGTLNEAALDESVGIGDGPDQTVWSPDNGASFLIGWGDDELDWDNANPFPDPSTVAVDVNNRGFRGCGVDGDGSPAPSPGDILAGYDDWSNLRYRLELADAGGVEADPLEMTPDVARRLRGCAANDTTPRCRPLGLEYAAKLVCGRQTAADSLMLARGHYATALNIHNPHNRDVRFYLKVALGSPPGNLRAGRQYRVGEGELRYDDVITADCNLLRDKIFDDGELPDPVIDGMFVLQTTARVDVRAVYTTAALTASDEAGAHSSIQVMEVSGQPTKRASPEPPTAQADLVVSDIDMANLRVSCPRGAGSCVTTVPATIRNIGGASAGVSTARATFDPSQSVNVSERTRRLAPGASTVIRFKTGRGGNCFDPDCTVCVTADAEDAIAEADETNNRFCRTGGG